MSCSIITDWPCWIRSAICATGVAPVVLPFGNGVFNFVREPFSVELCGPVDCSSIHTSFQGKYDPSFVVAVDIDDASQPARTDDFFTCLILAGAKAVATFTTSQPLDTRRNKNNNQFMTNRYRSKEWRINGNVVATASFLSCCGCGGMTEDVCVCVCACVVVTKCD